MTSKRKPAFVLPGAPIDRHAVKCWEVLCPLGEPLRAEITEKRFVYFARATFAEVLASSSSPPILRAASGHEQAFYDSWAGFERRASSPKWELQNRISPQPNGSDGGMKGMSGWEKLRSVAMKPDVYGTEQEAIGAVVKYLEQELQKVDQTREAIERRIMTLKCATRAAIPRGGADGPERQA